MQRQAEQTQITSFKLYCLTQKGDVKLILHPVGKSVFRLSYYQKTTKLH